MLSLLKAVTGESDEKEKDTMVLLGRTLHAARSIGVERGWESRI